MPLGHARVCHQTFANVCIAHVPQLTPLFLLVPFVSQLQPGAMQTRGLGGGLLQSGHHMQSLMQCPRHRPATVSPRDGRRRTSAVRGFVELRLPAQRQSSASLEPQRKKAKRAKRPAHRPKLPLKLTEGVVQSFGASQTRAALACQREVGNGGQFAHSNIRPVLLNSRLLSFLCCRQQPLGAKGQRLPTKGRRGCWQPYAPRVARSCSPQWKSAKREPS